MTVPSDPEALWQALHREAERSARRPPQPLPPRGHDARSGPAIDPGPAPAPVRDLEDALVVRRSVRQWADALPLAPLGAVLRAAVTGAAEAFGAERDAGVRVSPLLVANGVADLPRSVCTYDEPTSTLRSIASLRAEDVEAMVSQPELARAPAWIVIVGDLAAAIARRGEHGHRLLLLQAGVAAHAVVLAAISLGLDTCIFGALVSSELCRLADLDRYAAAPLLTVAVGAPAEDSR